MMAIHPTVLYSPDRHWRITADVRGTSFTVEYDLVLHAYIGSLPALEIFLGERGIELADLIQD